MNSEKPFGSLPNLFTGLDLGPFACQGVEDRFGLPFGFTGQNTFPPPAANSRMTLYSRCPPKYYVLIGPGQLKHLFRNDLSIEPS